MYNDVLLTISFNYIPTRKKIILVPECKIVISWAFNANTENWPCTCGMRTLISGCVMGELPSMSKLPVILGFLVMWWLR